MCARNAARKSWSAGAEPGEYARRCASHSAANNGSVPASVDSRNDRAMRRPVTSPNATSCALRRELESDALPRFSETVNVDPAPNSLSTVRSPCMPSARSRLIARPSPTPSRGFPKVRVQLDERLEDDAEAIRGDSGTGVVHFSQYPIADRLTAHGHRAARRCELHGVG